MAVHPPLAPPAPPIGAMHAGDQPGVRSGPPPVHRHYPGRIPDDFVPFPKAEIESSVGARFEAQVARHPDRIAIDSPAHQLTYGQLNQAANGFAHWLLGQPLAASELVALVMDLDDPFLPAQLGVLKAGKGYVFIDPTEPPLRMAEILRITGAQVVFSTARHADLVRPHLGSGQALALVEDVPMPQSHANPGVPLGPNHLAAVFFTSGSTGKPKGMVRDHRQLLYSTWMNTNAGYVSPSDRVANFYFPGFTASVPSLFNPLLNGAAIVPINTRYLSPREIWRWLRTQQITMMSSPVPLFRNFLDLDDEAPLADLRYLLLSGQSLYGADITAFQRRFSPNTILVNALAMTEAGGVAHSYWDHTSVVDAERVPVGYPVAGKEVLIVDEQGLPVAHDTVGEVVVCSHYLSLRYWQDEAQTQAKFRPAPDGSGRTLLFTGDQGLMHADGCLEYFGRADDMVKVRGYRIELGPIEANLRRYPGIKDVAVAAHEAPGQEARLVAYLLSHSATHITARELRQYLAQSLPDYMIPARFVYLASFPLTGNGKVNRRALPPPGRSRPQLSTVWVAPTSPRAQQLADLWAEILDLDQIGLDDSLVELGASSLQLARGIVRIEQEIGATLELAVWMQTPTLRNMLAQIEIGTSDPLGPKLPPSVPPPVTAHTGMLGLMVSIAKIGPKLGPFALPYAMGAPLLAKILHMPPIFHALAARDGKDFEAALVLSGQTDPTGDRLRTHFCANLWGRWRVQALRQPAVQHRWVTWLGVEHLEAAKAQNKRVVFVFLNTALDNQPATNFASHLLGEVLPILHANDRDPHVRAAQKLRLVQLAHNHLAKGGAIAVAGDGPVSSGARAFPFCGRTFHMPIGFADLAAHNDAWVIPVLTQVALDGRVTYEFGAPLIATGSPAARIDSFCAQYPDYLHQRWPEIMQQFVLHGLSRFLSKKSQLGANAQVQHQSTAQQDAD